LVCPAVSEVLIDTSAVARSIAVGQRERRCFLGQVTLPRDRGGGGTHATAEWRLHRDTVKQIPHAEAAVASLEIAFLSSKHADG